MIDCYEHHTPDIIIFYINSLHYVVSGYRWKTGRLGLHMAFLSTFGFPLVIFTAGVVYPIIMFIVRFAVLPSLSFSAIDQDGLRIAIPQLDIPLGRCQVMRNGETTCQFSWFTLIGVPLLLPVLFFGPQLVYFRTRLFLDRISTRKGFLKHLCKSKNEKSRHPVFGVGEPFLLSPFGGSRYLSGRRAVERAGAASFAAVPSE